MIILLVLLLFLLFFGLGFTAHLLWVVAGRVDPEVRALIRCHALGRLTVVGSGAGTQVVKGKRSAALKRPAGAFPPTAMSRPAAR